MKTCAAVAGRAWAPAEVEKDRAVPAVGRLSFSRNFLWTFVGNGVYCGCQWGLLVALARLGSSEMVGLFALALALTAPVFMFTNLQLRSVQATDAHGDFAFGDYLGVRLLLTLAALGVSAGVALFAGRDPEAVGVILAVAAAKAVESISDVIYGLLQQRERMDRISRSLMLRGATGLLALSGALALSSSLLWAVLALAVSWALVLLLHDLPSAAVVLSGANGPRQPGALQPRWQRGRLGKLVWLALPLGIVVCLISLNANIPRYFIEHSLGRAALGGFAAVAALMVVGNMVVSALAQAALPRLAVHHAAGNGAAFRRLLLRLVAVGGLLGLLGVLVAWLAGPLILRLCYGRDYAAYADLFVVLMAAAAVSYLASVLGFAITAARRFRIQAPLFVLITLASVLACALFVPRWQLQGAAWAVLAAMMVQLAGSAAVMADILVCMRKEPPR